MHSQAGDDRMARFDAFARPPAVALNCIAGLHEETPIGEMMSTTTRDSAVQFQDPLDNEGVDELLSRPTPGALATLRKLRGPFLVLGVGGKMGPTLARM